MGDPLALQRVRSDDEQYRHQAASEAAFWQQVPAGSLEACQDQQHEGPLDLAVNRRFTGDERVPWYETIARHGPFRRGAFLGTSSLVSEARILETNPSLHMTFYDLSDGGLVRRVEALGARFPGRVDTCRADLNFVDLPAASYDLIASSSTVHHVTNLEYLGWQINRALTPGGYFFLQDYVGEPRFQFDTAKRRVYHALYNRDRARQGLPGTDLSWLDTSDLSPFCGLRSDEILDVFRGQLDQVGLQIAGALTVPILRSRACLDAVDSPWRSDAWVNQSARRRWWEQLRKALTGRWRSQQSLLLPEFCNEIVLIGDVMADAGVLKPGVAFATYRKRA
ncbi:MAG: class I SAM-dependent methyltransferase [Candidatus Binatia bacterium]